MEEAAFSLLFVIVLLSTFSSGEINMKRRAETNHILSLEILKFINHRLLYSSDKEISESVFEKINDLYYDLRKADLVNKYKSDEFTKRQIITLVLKDADETTLITEDFSNRIIEEYKL